MAENKVGRPLKFKSVEEMQGKIDAYFDDCIKNERPYTITGLALALDTTRDLLLDYQTKDEYSDTIKKAKLRCENYAEEFLFKGKNVVGSIFNLKNNYKWVDQQVIKNETTTAELSDEEMDKRIKELMDKVEK